MDFKIVGLESKTFQHLFALDEDELRRQRAVRVIADGPGLPCRVGLRDADPGEEMLLLNFVHQEMNSPYRSSHAIYVARRSSKAECQLNEVPGMLSRRLISIRAFDRYGFMVDAEVCEGVNSTELFNTMLDRDDVSYLHAHTARRGCYLARIDRAT
jgi:hypothetical protein